MSESTLRRAVSVAVVSMAYALFEPPGVAAANLDPAFTASADNTVLTIAVQPDGKILLGGLFSSINGNARSYLARLNADGTLDASFDPQAAPAQAVYSVQHHGTGIFVGAYDGIRRYDLDGNLVWHHSIPGKTFAVDSEGRVVVGGQFSRIDNAYHRNIARLSSSGTLDGTFTTEVGCCAGEGVFALKTAGDSLLVGGLFRSINGLPASHIARLGSDGQPGATFSGSADPAVLAFAPLPDGRFLRVSERSVARHLSNGERDNSFAILDAAGGDGRFFTAALQNDRALVAGRFYLGAGMANIARLLSDGTIDDTFALEPNGPVHAVATQANGGILIGGAYTAINGAAHVGIARILPDSESVPPPQLRFSAGQGTIVLSWPAQGSFRLQSAQLSSNAWSDVPGTPTISNGWNYFAQSASGPGRLYRLRNN